MFFNIGKIGKTISKVLLQENGGSHQTFTTLLANSADHKNLGFFLFFPKQQDLIDISCAVSTG